MILKTCSLRYCAEELTNNVVNTFFQKKSLILIFLSFWMSHIAKNEDAAPGIFKINWFQYAIEKFKQLDMAKFLSLIQNIEMCSIAIFTSSELNKYFFFAATFVGAETIYDSNIKSYFDKKSLREREKINKMFLNQIFHYEKITPGKVKIDKLIQLQKFYMNSVDEIIRIAAAFIVFAILSAFLPGTQRLCFEVCCVIVITLIIVCTLTYFIHKQIDGQVIDNSDENSYNIDWFNYAFSDIVYFFFLTTTCYFIPMYILKDTSAIIYSINLFVFYIVLFQNSVINHKSFFKNFMRSIIEIESLIKETKTPSFSKKIKTISINSEEYDLEMTSDNIYWFASEPYTQDQLQKQIIFGKKKINGQYETKNIIQKCSVVIKENSDLSILQFFQLANHSISSESIVKTLSMCKFFEGGDCDYVSRDFLQKKCNSFNDEQRCILSLARALIDNSDILIIKDCFREVRSQTESTVMDLLSANKKIVLIFSGKSRKPRADLFSLLHDQKYSLYSKATQ